MRSLSRTGAGRSGTSAGSERGVVVKWTWEDGEEVEDNVEEQEDECRLGERVVVRRSRRGE